jgi:hypothetical protein
MMNDFTNNNSFEEQWQKAFDDASLTPSDSVWEKIEQGLSIEQTPLPQSPKNTFPWSYLGAVLAVLLGVASWLFIQETQFQAEKPVEIQEKQVIKMPENTNSTSVIAQKENVRKPLNLPMKTNLAVPQKEEVPEEQPNLVQEEIVPERIKLADSISTLSPLPAKNLTGSFQTPPVEIQTETTPYYEPTKPKPKKNSIFKNVKISVGIGTYQH